MRVSQTGISQSYKQNFGHTFKVSICVKDLENQTYKFISPIKDKVLYKQLNSKVVGWLNEQYLAKLRSELKKPKKRVSYVTDNEVWHKNRLAKLLYNLDSDYRKFNTVRSIYNRKGLAYIATGVDVPIIENLKGATQIGVAKSEALLKYNTTHTDYVDEIVKNFRNNSIEYAKDKSNLLRSKDGKEIMLRLNFLPPKPNAKGKIVYELENAEFYEIKKSIPITQKEQQEAQKKKAELWEYVSKTVKHQISNITHKDNEIIDIDRVLSPMQERPKRARKLKNNPRQLELFG